MSVNTTSTEWKGFVPLPFLVFIRIADAHSQVSAREAEAFIKLIQAPEWCKSGPLRNILKMTREQYPELWKQYIVGSLGASNNQIKSYLEELSQQLVPSEKELLIDDLLSLAQAIVKASGVWSGRLASHKGKKDAFKELEQILRPSSPTVGEIPMEKSQDEKVSKKNLLPDSDTLSVPKEKSLFRVPSSGVVTDLAPLVASISESVSIWKRGKVVGRCVKVIQETHDVKTFRFVAEPPVLFFFKPGQFVTLDLEIEGKPIRRSYTISSTPSRPHTLSITVKRVSNGLVSNWLHDHLKEGDTLMINGPNGKFTCLNTPSRKILLLSGGSGITPTMSMARWLYDTCSDYDIVFVHSASTPCDIIFRRELELMASQMPNFKLAINCSRGVPGNAWSGFQGRLNRRMLELMVPDYLERTLYVCGPVPFMETVKEILANTGFPTENYYQESFGGLPKKKRAVADTGSLEKRDVVRPKQELEEPLPALEPIISPQGNSFAEKASNTRSQIEAPCKIIFTQSGKEVSCRAEDAILDIAEEQGIEIPSSCRAGSCGTCKVLKKEGIIRMDSTDGLSDAEKEEGYILTCCGYPEGTVVLDV
jgi:ferredoxin-NADP reductase